jgi:Tfp pilus assembly protein PilO
MGKGAVGSGPSFLEVFGLPLAVLVIGLWAYNEYVYTPLTVREAQLNKAIDDLHVRKGSLATPEEVRKTVQRARARLEEQREALVVLEEEFDQVHRIIAGRDEVADLINRINIIAERHGLKVNAITPIVAPTLAWQTEDTDPALLQMSHHSMTLTGRYHDLVEFCQEINRVNDRLVLVERIEVTVANKHPQIRALIELGI